MPQSWVLFRGTLLPSPTPLHGFYDPLFSFFTAAPSFVVFCCRAFSAKGQNTLWICRWNLQKCFPCLWSTPPLVTSFSRSPIMPMPSLRFRTLTVSLYRAPFFSFTSRGVQECKVLFQLSIVPGFALDYFFPFTSFISFYPPSEELVCRFCLIMVGVKACLVRTPSRVGFGRFLL